MPRSKRCRSRFAVGVDPQVRGEARPVLLRDQRAPAVRQLLRQHRHDAVGEVDGIAAVERRLVERAARPHVVGHVGDRHQQAPAAGIAGVRVGSAQTASSKSRASSPSMVTSGTLRRSTRPFSSAGPAAFACASASSEKACGMSWSWMVINEIDLGPIVGPSRSTIRALFSPSGRPGWISAHTNSPASAPRRASGGSKNSARARFSTGTMRMLSPTSVTIPSVRSGAAASRRITRASYEPDPVCFSRASTRSPGA